MKLKLMLAAFVGSLSSRAAKSHQEARACKVLCGLSAPKCPPCWLRVPFWFEAVFCSKSVFETYYMDLKGTVGKPLSNGKISAVGPCSFPVPTACPAPGGYGRLSIMGGLET